MRPGPKGQGGPLGRPGPNFRHLEDIFGRRDGTALVSCHGRPGGNIGHRGRAGERQGASTCPGIFPSRGRRMPTGASKEGAGP
eukprot:646653-Pyramimonas_sp.AAC.1